MTERMIDSPIAVAFANLKASLIKRGCKIVSEGPPNIIVVKQGSVWGTSPRTAKKLIHFRLASHQSGTQISVSSSFSSDWKNLTLMGSVFAVVMLSLCLWITFDLQGFTTTGQPTFWSWIATAGGYANFQTARKFATITTACAVFLAIAVALEAVIVIYCYRGLNDLAEETLNLVP